MRPGELVTFQHARSERFQVGLAQSPAKIMLYPFAKQDELQKDVLLLPPYFPSHNARKKSG